MSEPVTISKLICERCGHEWVPRVLTVKTCPSCRSPYWDTPKQTKEPQSQGEKNETC